MSRAIGVNNTNEVTSSSLEMVLLVHFAFDTPLYVHTGLGNITWSTFTWLGVGEIGSVEGVEEKEQLSPAPVRLVLSGVLSADIAEAFDAGNFGNRITIYRGYRNPGGALVADPTIETGGTFEYADIELGKQNRVVITMQHDISRLNEKSGRRYSDEDQRQEYPDDEGFSFVHGLSNQTLLWGGQIVSSVPTGGGGGGEESRDE